MLIKKTQPKIVNVSEDQCQVSLNIGRINGVEIEIGRASCRERVYRLV